MTLEEVETKEEITHVPQRRRTSSRLSSERLSSTSSGETVEYTVLPGGMTAKHEAVATEQLTTSSCEERQRFVIKSVFDPVNNKQISFQVSTSSTFVKRS